MDIKVVSHRRVPRKLKVPRAAHLALGVATLWLPVYFLLFMIVWVRLAISIVSGSGQPLSFFSPWLIVTHVLSWFVNAALVVFYVIHLFRNGRIEPNMKAVWAVVLLMGGLFAMPAYWYLYFWRR